MADVRIHPIPKPIIQLHIYGRSSEIKQHARYQEAKAGDASAALELVMDLALPKVYEWRDAFPRDSIFVAPHAVEAKGDNAIPQVFAEVCAIVCGATADSGIVQVTKVYHTGADPMERMISRPVFDGEVVQGGKYVLVDDVTNLGCTLAELANYVQAGGGEVVGVFVLVNDGREKPLHPNAKDVRKISERYGNEIISIFGVHANALTFNEARYLINFRNADEIRGRRAKARKEINLRLRAKGVFFEDSTKD